MGGGPVDFFISHAGDDRAWAEWVAWQLLDAGYTVELDAWDWPAGHDFMQAMSEALDRCEWVVALYSTAYFDRSRYTTLEWSAAALPLLYGQRGRIIPVQVEYVPAPERPAVLRNLIPCDLTGLPPEQARRTLADAASGRQRTDGTELTPDRGQASRWRGPPGAHRPDREPDYPGRRVPASAPRADGGLPAVWNVPACNPWFAGRDEMLTTLRSGFLTTARVPVQALYGLGGIGKTQLAIEYAYEFAGSYELIWWVQADQAALISDQFAALAVELGYVAAAATSGVAKSAALRELRQRRDWLLVFDDVTEPAAVTEWLPGGGGHVLITSRRPSWANIAWPVPVRELARQASVAILAERVPGLSASEADELAAELGDLPLALNQAAGFMSESGIAAARYLPMLRSQTARAMTFAQPPDYPRPLAAVIMLTAEQLAAERPAAAELASLFAFFAPEPIPDRLLAAAGDQLPTALAAQVADPFDRYDAVAQLVRRSLARIEHDGPQLHTLTQAILRDRLGDDEAKARVRGLAEAAVAASNPGEPDLPATWPQWGQLMPHLLAADLDGTSSAALRATTADACWYLIARGDAPVAQDLARRLYDRWRARLGDDHEHTLAMGYYLAWALGRADRNADALALAEEILSRRRLVLGPNHPETLTSASGVIRHLRALSRLRAARDLAQDTLARRTEVLGPDHRDTLTSASVLAAILSELGERDEARKRDEDILIRFRRVLGEDHPDTLTSANNLAASLSQTRDWARARGLAESTFARRRDILGANHPDTLVSADNLANTLAELDEKDAARKLAEDTLVRRRQVYGHDDLGTLICANNLAEIRDAVGDTDAAADLGLDTLSRFRRVLGDDHGYTLACASALARWLRVLGQTLPADELDQQTTAQVRRVLGESHPGTLLTDSDLAAYMRAGREL